MVIVASEQFTLREEITEMCFVCWTRLSDIKIRRWSLSLEGME